MGKPDRRKIARMLDGARMALVIALLGAVIAQSGLLDGACSERAYAETASSHSIAKSIGKVSQYDNGEYVHDFDEGILGVNGEVAFCMDPNIDFKSGTVSSADILSAISQPQLTEIALRTHFIRDVYQNNQLSDNARLILAQTLVWEVLSPSQSFVVTAAEHGGSFPEVTMAVREDACTKARAFAVENATRYDSFGTLWLNGDTQPVATFGCELAVGTLDLLKQSSNPFVSDGSEHYSLAGAVYGAYTDNRCTAEACRLTTDANGYAKSKELHTGTYYVREVSAPPGFALDAQVYPVAVSAGQTTRVGGGKVYDSPIARIGLAAIDKHDAEVGWRPEPSVALGSATVAGAHYKVEHYGGIFDNAQAAAASGSPRATWEFATDHEGRIDLTQPDSFLIAGTLYRDADGTVVFPIGTYVIRETAPPDGYLPSEDTFVLRVRQSGNGTSVDGTLRTEGNRTIIAAPEQVKRSDLSLTKVRESDMKRLGGVPFMLTSETTGESHVVVSDENGRIDTAASWNLHTFRTNLNDDAVAEGGNVDEGKLDATAGIWFGNHGGSAMTQANDALGALPYDTYTLQELSCSANAGLLLVRMEGIAVTRDGVTLELGTIDDKEAQTPSIATVAYDALDKDKVVDAEESAVVTDEVELANLVPGRTYTLYGTVVDVRTGLPVLASREKGTGPEGEAHEDEREPGSEAIAEGEQPEEGLQGFWDGLADILGTTRTPSIDGFSYEIGPDAKMDADAIGQYMAANESIFAQMVMASREFTAEAPRMVTALDYEMDASKMDGDYVIYDLLVADDGTMALHADSENERESFTVEQPEPQPEPEPEPEELEEDLPRKGYYKTGSGIEGPIGASGMVIAGTAIGASAFLGRRFGWSVPFGRKHA